MKIFYFPVFAALVFSPLLPAAQTIPDLKPMGSTGGTVDLINDVPATKDTSLKKAALYDSPFEEFIAKYDSCHIFKQVKEKTGASLDQFNLFCSYYKDSVMSDNPMFGRAYLNGQIKTDEDVKLWAQKRIEYYVALYTKFAVFAKEFPESIREAAKPHRPAPPTLNCNTPCSNIDFETGDLRYWTACDAENTSSYSFTYANLNCSGPLGPGVTSAAVYPWTGLPQVTITSGGYDPIAGHLIPTVCPIGGNYSVRIGDGAVPEYGVGIVEQTFKVTPDNANFTYMYAVVLENPSGHPYYVQPYLVIELIDQNGNDIPGCGEYFVDAAATTPGFTPIYYPPDGDIVYCKPWQTELIPLNAYIGTCVTIKATVSDCGYGGHFGYAYFDALCDTIKKSPVICGTKNATLTAPPGAGGYQWLGPCIVDSTTTRSITVSCAGTYSCVLTSSISSACDITLTTKVAFDPPLSFNLLSTKNVTCFGGSNGASTVIAVGGTSPYTYSWAAPASGSNPAISGLIAGTYTVYAKDSVGCEDTIGVGKIKIIITQPPPIKVSTVNTNENCGGGNNASATATVVSGGITPFTYSWSPKGGTTAAATALFAGIYTINVTDSTGCIGSATANITQPQPVTVKTDSTQTACTSNTGTATVTGGGGTPKYSYLWFNGSTNPTVTGLGIGSYSVTITDAGGCSITASVGVTVVGGGSVTATTNSNVSCFAGSNGSATAIMKGGFVPYTYSWAPVKCSNAAITGLTAGTYSVTVTDADGCIVMTTDIITQPTLLTVTIPAITNVSCNGGDNGSLSAVASGGTTSYAYAWNPSGETTPVATNLSHGSYTITVTDANGCIAKANAAITQPTPLAASITGTGVSCNGGNNGTAAVLASGATPPYTYGWSPIVSSNATDNGLTAGTYQVIITDSNNCSISKSVIITQPLVLTASMGAPVNVLCNGGSNGNATVAISGGTGPYTYLWSPSGGKNPEGTGFSAGTYTVNVTDAHNCMVTANVIITQPAVLTATASASQTACTRNTGTATAAPGGGTPPYTYLWTPSAQTNITATGLSMGNYTVRVTDSDGCNLTTSAVVTMVKAGTVAITATTDVSCFAGSDGSATSVMTGNAPPFTYLWGSYGGTNSRATGLAAGTYTITVTDTSGCVTFTTALITQPTLLTAAIPVVKDVTCNGFNDGKLKVVASGGTTGYVYSWAPIGRTNDTAMNLSPVSYTITVTDAHGCIATATAVITQPTALNASVAGTNISCMGGSNGTATVTPGGATPPYTYLWSPVTSATPTDNTLTAGTYTVLVTDSHGCIFIDSIALTQPPLLTATMRAPVNVLCYAGNDGSATSVAAGGTPPYIYNWTPSGGVDTTAPNLVAGAYTFNVTDSHNCSANVSVTITQPAVLTVTPSGPASICDGVTATITSLAAGGTAPYLYSWSTGATTSATQVTPPVNAGYTITVTDSHGCMVSDSLTIRVSTPLHVIASGATAFCLGGTATLLASASGGDGIYTYTWLPGNDSTQTINVTPNATTTYTIQVNDACGSTMASDTVTVDIAPYPSVSLAANPITGCEPLCVHFNDLSSISFGTINQWKWSYGNGDSSSERNPTYCYQDTGTYTVSLTAVSNFGCSSTLVKLKMITVYPHPQAAFSYTPQYLDIYNSTVQFTDNSYDKYSIVYWYWTFGDGSDSNNSLQNPSHEYGDTGAFCPELLVMDVHGCLDSAVNCLIVNPGFTLYIPDAFSPNGDGINDIFEPKGTYIKDFEMYIFDRWGMQLYHTTDIMKGWDGRVNGNSSIAQEDTYIYTIKVIDTRDGVHSYIGNVYLIK